MPNTSKQNMKEAPPWENVNCLILNTPGQRQIRTSVTLPPGRDGKPLQASKDPPPYAVFTDGGVTFVFATLSAPIVVQVALDAFPQASQEEVEGLFKEAHPKFSEKDVRDVVLDLGPRRAMSALAYVTRDRN